MYNSLLRIYTLSLLKLLLVCTLTTSNPIRCYYGDKKENHCITDNKLGWCASFLVNFRDRNDEVYIEKSKYSCASNDLYDHPFWCDETRDDKTYLKAGTCRTHSFTMANNGTIVSGIYCCCQKEFCNSADPIQWLESGYAPTINDEPTSTSQPSPTMLTYQLHQTITVSSAAVHSVAVTPSSPVHSSFSTVHHDFSLPEIPPRLLQAISAATGIASPTSIFKSNFSTIPFPTPGPFPGDAGKVITGNQLPPFTVPKAGMDNKDRTSFPKVNKWWLIGGGALLLTLLILSLIFIVLLCYWQKSLCFKPKFEIEHNPSYDSPPRVAKMLVTDMTAYPARVWFHDDQRPNSIIISDMDSSHSASSSGYTDRPLPPFTSLDTVKSML